MNQEIRFDVVIVTYNSARWVRGCVQALAGLDYPASRLHLILVDNGSVDGTPQKLRALATEFGCFGGFSLLEAEDNPGFGAACNRGAAHGTAPYLFFLNADTEILPDALNELEQGMARSPHAGMWELRQIPLEAQKWYDPVTLETGWCSGAAMVMPRSVFEKTGGFDEAIFMYCEDVDLSWRVRALGKTLYYVPRAQVRHYTDRTYEGKTAHANRNILLNNHYLRLKYGTKADLQSFWAMVRHLETLPDWKPLLTGLRPRLLQRKKPRRPDLGGRFTPVFNGLSYDRELFFSEEEAGPPDGAPPNISILIRTHGRPHLLRQALQTVANQTVSRGFEVVVVEDGPATARPVIEEFGTLPLRYEATGQPVGRSAAGNRAIALARGEYLCFLDEDDWLLANYLETWQRLCVRHPGHRLFFAGSLQLAGGYGPDGVQWSTRRSAHFMVGEVDRLSVAMGNPVPIQAVLFHRSLPQQLGGLDDELDAFEDWNLWQRYASREEPVCANVCTSAFKIPADVVAMAQRDARLKQYARQCFEKGEAYPLHTSMGQLARRCCDPSRVNVEPLLHAEEYYRTAREIAGSTLWRATRPLRRLGDGLMRLGGSLSGMPVRTLPEDPDAMHSVEEYIEFIQLARASPSWKMTAFLRGRDERPE